MSIQGRPDRARSIATIHAALDAGITLIDTADAYTTTEDGQGHNEELIAEALDNYGSDTSHVLVATKGGLVNESATAKWATHGTPGDLKKAAKASLARLGGDSIGLYQFHRPDPKVDYADSVGALSELLDDGVIRMAGISNVTIAQIDIAREVLGGRLVSVQNQFSPAHHDSLDELDYCVQHGIAFLPWSPLGGISNAADLGAEHRAFASVAEHLGVSAQQVTLAWELSLGSTVIPIPGASRPESIGDSAMAADLELTDEQVAALSASVPAR